MHKRLLAQLGGGGLMKRYHLQRYTVFKQCGTAGGRCRHRHRHRHAAALLLLHSKCTAAAATSQLQQQQQQQCMHPCTPITTTVPPPSPALSCVCTLHLALLLQQHCWALGILSVGSYSPSAIIQWGASSSSPTLPLLKSFRHTHPIFH